MDFIQDFIGLTPDYFYIALSLLLFTTACVCGVQRFIGPIAIASIYFYGAALLMMGAGIEQFLQGLVLIICYFVFLFLGVRSPLLRIPRSTSSIRESSGGYIFFILVVSIVYASFIGYLFFKYARDSRIDKINWVDGAGGLPYVLALLNGVLLSIFFMLLVSGNYFLFLIVGALLVFGGSVFGEKGVVINLAVVVVSVVFQKPMRPLDMLCLFFLLVIISALTAVLFFGGASVNSGDAFVAFLGRLAASFDGTMIILETHMYDSYRLPNTVFYYIFDFIVSKIYGVGQGIGQLLASTNVYTYPPNGGPNDSLINYFLLSGLDGKIIVGGFVSVFAFFLGMLDSAIKTGRINSYTAAWKLILLPLYFYMPTFFQATGTAFLLLARYYVLLIPLVFVFFVFKEVAKNVRFR